MPSARQDANVNSDPVHVIDIETDIDTLIHSTLTDYEDKPELLNVKIEEMSESAIINGNGIQTNPKAVDMAEIVQRARDTFNRGVTKPIEWRRKQLKNLLRMYKENRNAMSEALRKDLHRCKLEVMLLEVDFLINDIKNTLQNLEDWAGPDKLPKGIVNMLDDLLVYKDPYGVVLVIGAWNYPLNLLLLPMGGAIAAGNTVIVKPSEVAVACAKFVAKTLPKYLDNDAVFVVEGGPQETTELLKQKFDYIFYTGSTNVGKSVYEAATKHLTPVTLELGGKSPVFIDNTTNILVTTKRVLWGKFINAGQTCVAPDYLLCTKETQDKFVEAAKKILREWYGDEPQQSPDFGRIINSRHFARLQALMDASKDKVAIGGKYDANDKFIEPTILTNVTSSDKIMEVEIFGPIFPIVPIENAYEAIKFINSRGKPLVFYLFTTSNKVQTNFIVNTSSGGLCINDTTIQMPVQTYPFGGVGESGMGAYHGKTTFDTFTHKKSCLNKDLSYIGEKLGSLRYPPYNETNLKIITFLLKKRYEPSLNFLPYLLTFVLGAGLSYGIFAWHKVESEDL